MGSIPTVLKAAQLMALVTFFVGTLHVVRLFVAHRQALAKWEPDRTILTRQFEQLERRALYYLIWPSLVVVLLLGIWMMWQRPGLLKLPFMQVGIGLVALLIGYHLMVHRLHIQLRKGTMKWSALQLHLWAQGAPILLFALIVLALVRDRLTWLWGALGLLVVGALVMVAITSVRDRGNKDNDAEAGNESP